MPSLDADQLPTCLTTKPHAFLNSQHANEPMQQRRQGEQTVVIHPIEAAARKVKNGDYIRAFNGRGAFEGKAELSTDVWEGLAAANLGYWPSLTAVARQSMRRLRCQISI
jgi:anaerobic selenocysteine-containing dehydrogenase